MLLAHDGFELEVVDTSAVGHNTHRQIVTAHHRSDGQAQLVEAFCGNELAQQGWTTFTQHDPMATVGQRL